MPETAKARFIKKLRSHIKGARVGFLLGAGSSCLSGAGYPLARGLWDEISLELNPDDSRIVGQIMVGRQCGLEEALDILDTNPSEAFPLREEVAKAVATVFGRRRPLLDFHRRFLRNLARRADCHRVPILSLNYDPLIELAALEEGVLVCDGFSGGSRGYFDAAALGYFIGTLATRRGRAVTQRVRGVINLLKLHGSLGWFQLPGGEVRRIDFELPPPEGARRLMIPPQRRKAQDTAVPPYSDLWSEFRGLLGNDGSRLISRLVCLGYGFRDEHVNAIIRAALRRSDFTLLILSKTLEDGVYETWAHHDHVIVATEARCSLYGAAVEPMDAWSFEWLSEEV